MLARRYWCKHLHLILGHVLPNFCTKHWKRTLSLRPSLNPREYWLYLAGGHGESCPFSRWAYLRKACNRGLASKAWHFPYDQWSPQHQRAPTKLGADADDSKSEWGLAMIQHRSLLTTIFWSGLVHHRIATSWYQLSSCIVVLMPHSSLPLAEKCINCLACLWIASILISLSRDLATSHPEAFDISCLHLQYSR